MHRVLALATLILIFSAAQALASTCPPPPQAQPHRYQPIGATGVFSVFGTQTLQKGQVGFGLAYEAGQGVCQDLDNDLDQNTLFLPVAVGITDRLQIGAEIPYTWWEPDRYIQWNADKNYKREHGLDDITLGLKYRFLEEAAGRPSVALLVHAALPTADRDKGLGTEKADYGASLILSKAIGSARGHVNLGYTVVGEPSDMERDSELTYGVGVEMPLSGNWQGLVEVVGNTNRNPTGASSIQLEGKAGARYVSPSSWIAGLGARVGFADDSPEFGLVATLTFVFPGEKKPAPPVTKPEAKAPEAPPPAPPTVVRLSLDDVHFEFDKAALRPEARKIIEKTAQELKARQATRVEIEGHTCNIGTVDYNLALGDRRARAVADYLILLGIEPDRLSTVSYGEERPAHSNDTEETRQLNRRTHFRVTAQ